MHDTYKRHNTQRNHNGTCLIDLQRNLIQALFLYHFRELITVYQHGMLGQFETVAVQNGMKNKNTFIDLTMKVWSASTKNVAVKMVFSTRSNMFSQTLLVLWFRSWKSK